MPRIFSPKTVKEAGTTVATSAASALDSTTSTALPVVGPLAGGVNMVGDAISAGESTVAVVENTVALGSAVRNRLKLSEAKKDPELQGLLHVRSCCDGLLKLQNAAIEDAQKQITRLEGLKAKVPEALADPAKAGLTPMEASLLQQEDPHAAVDRRLDDLKEQMQALEQAKQPLDDTINAVNGHPKIRAASFRKLEAKHDLTKHMGEEGRKSVRDMLSAGKDYAATAADLTNTLSATLQVAGIGGQLATTVLSGAGAGASIVTGGLMVAAGSASLAFNAYEHHLLSKRQDAATDTINDIGARTGVDMEVKDGEKLSAAFERIEKQAKSDKTVKKMEMARDGAAIVAGSAAVLAGTSALIAVAGGAASVAGFGAGAVPGIALTAATGGVALGAGTVAAGAAIGVEIYKHTLKTGNMAKVGEAKLALEALNIESATLNAPNQAEREKIAATLTPEHTKALVKIKENIRTNMEKGGIPPAKIAEHLNDHDLVSHYAACVLLKRDSASAVNMISKSVVADCHDAFLKRAQGGATSIVESDLPKNSAAINGLKRLGMTEAQLTRTVNAIAHTDTRKLGEDMLVKKTGLTHKSR